MKESTYDPLAGVTASTRKDELMDRLRRARAALRRQDRQDMERLAGIEARLQAKYQDSVTAGRLKQAIVSSTEEEWKEGIEFLEEFEDLAPALLQRIIIGGRALLGQLPTEPDPEETTGP